MINLSVIKNISRAKKCPPGTVITGSGTEHVMFVVLKGDIGIYRGRYQPGAKRAASVGAGGFFADPGLVCGKKAMYTAVAMSEAIVLPVKGKAAAEFIQEEPALAFEMIRELCARLERAGALLESGEETSGAAEGPKLEKKPEEKPKRQEKQPPDRPPESPPQAAAATGDRTGEILLFPEGHGRYVLPADKQGKEYLMNKTHACPICKGSFSAFAVRPSKLTVESIDSDMRYRYKGIEPLYYEVLTCPNCLYSALPDVFNSPEKSKPDILRELERVKEALDVRLSPERDADTVFAGYYLALHCAPISFIHYQLSCGKLYHKLSRIYQDVGDAAMEDWAAGKALENYLYAYTKTTMNDSLEQQVCVLIGELYLRQKDYKNAFTFFSRAKSSSASPVLKSHAENRIYDIRSAMEGGQK